MQGWFVLKTSANFIFRTILQSSTKMLTFGGDHYVTYPLLIAHAEKYGAPLSLIHFDAHCDTWADDGSPEQMNHGTMFYKAVKEGTPPNFLVLA